MFRLIHDAVGRLLSRPHSSSPTVGDWDLAREVRTPDPYVWRLPSPYEARRRRWAKRCRAVGHYVPFPHEEERENRTRPVPAAVRIGHERESGDGPHRRGGCQPDDHRNGRLRIAEVDAQGTRRHKLRALTSW